MKLSIAALLTALCLLTACESTGRSGSSLKDAIKTRSIERARLHDETAIKDAYDKSAEDPDEVILLFLNACLLVEDNKEAGNHAIAYLSRKNDQWEDAGSATGVKLSQAASEGLNRIAGNSDIIRSYCGGDGENFPMDNPEVVKLRIKETRKMDDNTTKYFLWSSGKDNASPVTIKRDGGNWYVDEWSSLQTGVTAR